MIVSIIGCYKLAKFMPLQNTPAIDYVQRAVPTEPNAELNFHHFQGPLRLGSGTTDLFGNVADGCPLAQAGDGKEGHEVTACIALGECFVIQFHRNKRPLVIRGFLRRSVGRRIWLAAFVELPPIVEVGGGQIGVMP